MADDELNQIAARCALATNGPWKSFVEGRDHSSGSNFIRTATEDIQLIGGTIADQDFIAAARQDVPSLIAEVHRLKTLLASMNSQ